MTELTALIHPDAESPLFAEVHPRDEIYDGPYLDRAPDLVAVPADPRWGLGGAVGKEMLEPPGISGTHHPEGIFMAWGRDVVAAQVHEASILDIAPTALHALGLPIPQDCDGSVQLHWYNPESQSAARPVRTEKIEAETGHAYAWTAEEEAEVEARLRGLGYLD
jgi:predicted AlkP superfamily phosphohydrolase/phosphomutase